jgi:hypothetical protein
MEQDPHTEGVRQSIEDIIGSNTSLRRKKKSEDDVNREKFEKIIQALDEAEVRSVILGNDLKLDFSTYDEKFYSVIDELMLMMFGKEACELIFFYLYERMNPDGTANELVDLDNNPVTLNSPTDLWNLVKLTQEKVGKGKKK